jgi:hypothetical protein
MGTCLRVFFEVLCQRLKAQNDFPFHFISPLRARAAARLRSRRYAL